jgi:hypothetical protein
MTTTMPSKICIIGAGISGLTAATLFIKQGYNVTIFEQEEIPGGRALSLDGSTLTLDAYKELLSRFNMKVAFAEPDITTIFSNKMLDGYQLDLGYHAIGGGVFSNVNNLLSHINDHVNILESYVGLIKEDGYNFPFLSRWDKIKILPNILRLLFASEATLQRLDKVSITETIHKYGKGKMKLILEIFSRSITTINNLDRISTGEMFRSQRNLYRGSKPVGYPKQGLASIHKKLVNYVTSHGGILQLGTPVEKIRIQDGKAVGVRVDGKDYDFDVVISSIFIQNLFSLADPKHFPKEFVKKMRSLQGTGSLCAYYALRHMPSEFLGKTFHFIERNVGLDGNDAVGMVDFMAAHPDSGISPSGCYLVQSYIICTPEEAQNTKVQGTLKKLLDENLRRLIPDYKQSLLWAIYPAIWHLDGVAKTIDNVKPPITTPVENLFVIGDCVKAMGIGFNCALNSARLVVDYLATQQQLSRL